jgi:hypothetical protein
VSVGTGGGGSVGVRVWVDVGTGVFVCVGIGVTVGTFGTNKIIPAKMDVEVPRQFASCNSVTVVT